MEKNKINLIILLSLAIVAFLFTGIVALVDVNAIGPLDSKVGFSSINGAFRSLIGQSDLFYQISKYLGYLAILVAVGYVVLFIYSAIKNKSLKLVSKNLYALFAVYCLTVLVYVLFEIVVVNYRPVLEDGVLEASFPSSHTMLACVICATAVLTNVVQFKSCALRKIGNVALIVLAVAIIVFRTLSGVHWLTDIVGAIIYSAVLAFAYYTAVCYFNQKEKSKKLD